MKTAVMVLTLLWAAVVPAAAQVGDDIAVTLPPSRSAAAGPGEPDPQFFAGVYLLSSTEAPYDGAYGTLNSIITFNGDACTDSTPLYDGVVNVVAATNSAAHGTWSVSNARELRATLYYFSTSKAGVMDRLGRATLHLKLDETLATGVGTIYFDFHIPSLFPDLGAPIGAEVKMPVRVMQLR